MGKEIDFRPTHEIKFRTGRKKIKTGLGNLFAVFADQHTIQNSAQAMEIKNIVCRVNLLFFGEGRATPIGGLLLFAELDPEKFFAQFLERMTVGKGANEARCNFGAVYRSALDAEISADRSDIKSPEMEYLFNRGVGQKTLEIGGIIPFANRKTDEVGITVPERELDKAKPVADQIETHRLGINSDRGTKSQIVRQIMCVQIDRHTIRSIAKSYIFQGFLRG